MNIVTIGGATQDICVYYENQEIICLDKKSHGNKQFLLLPEGAKIELESVAYFPGGGAHNASVSYARQGFNAGIICCIGNDCQGSFVVENLKKNKVSTNYVAYSHKGETGFSVVIPLSSGDRTVLINRGANLALTNEHIPQNAFTAINQLYITSLTGITAKLLPDIVSKARQEGVSVAVNPGSSQLRTNSHYLIEALHSIHILILNSYEATLFMESFTQRQLLSHKNIPIMPLLCSISKTLPFLLTNQSSLDIRLFCAYVQSQGPKIVVVTNGAEGVYVATKHCLYFYPSQPARVVCTLGAGDAFGSGFVGHLARGGTIEDAILYGIANSHSVISYYGAQRGLLTLPDLTNAARALDATLLQEYSLA